jgi:pilus assembly protein CpaB
MKRALPIILAVVLAIIAAVIVFVYTRGAEQRVIDEQQPVSVLVSTAIIPKGVSLGDAFAGGLAEQTQIPSSMNPAGSIAAVTPENSALVSLTDVPPGQILLQGNFASELPEAVSIDIPDGQLAITITLGDPERVANFVRPGSQIVIFDTYTSSVAAADTGEPPVQTTRVLMPQITVLAVGDSTTTAPTTNPDGTAAAQAPSALLTLAVDQDQAERIIQSTKSGSLYLGLLGDGTEIRTTNGTTDGNLFE